ncbi:unnamed protein product [Ilex paraguariensis]|uniref:Uncharacterized protein n=1 Tax=Ilex paraguariensis TaxID=185542 RepID=A0ABC8QN81_9AQUA
MPFLLSLPLSCLSPITMPAVTRGGPATTIDDTINTTKESPRFRYPLSASLSLSSSLSPSLCTQHTHTHIEHTHSTLEALNFGVWYLWFQFGLHILIVFKFSIYLLGYGLHSECARLSNGQFY